MNRAEEKSIRLLQIEQLLWAHPEGLTRAEIARRLSVDRSVITKYLQKGHIPPSIYEDDEDDNKLKLDRSADLTKAAFNLHEVMAIHLATRLLATRFDKHNPHAASALRKIGKALQRLDRNISQHLLRSADVMDEDNAFRDPVYLDVLEKLTIAWAAGRKVKVSHRMPDGWVADYILSPYFIEPYAVGQTTHVIGLREPLNEIRTLKIERIRSAEITSATFQIPESFDPRALLRDAWGIWYTEEKPTGVALKFHPRVATRVRESRWHRSQKIEEQTDGYLVWRAEIAEPQEMLPWIRGWGADVEVLEPKELREELMGEVKRMARRYGVLEAKTMSNHWLLRAKWAKRNNKNPDQYHPLLCHLIDVGQVTRLIWREVFTATTRVRLSSAFSLPETEMERLVTFVCAIHDIGKTSPSFQKQSQKGRMQLEDASFYFASNLESCRHEAISYLTLANPDHQGLLLNAPTQWNADVTGWIAGIVSGHHGKWMVNPHLKSDQIGDGLWNEARAELFAELYRIFSPPTVTTIRQDDLTATLVVLSGLVSVADWIGSREDSFQFASSASGEVDLDLSCYVQLSEERAYKALHKLNWLDWQPPDLLMSFQSQFAVEQPRPMQTQVIELATEQSRNIDANTRPEPTIVIVEDATGSGKTEAALYLADHWSALFKHRGAYVAMPTMATSNGMFRRYDEVLRRRYSHSPNLQLAHSQAAYQDTDTVELHDVGDRDKASEASDDTAKAENWFAPRKRTLLATFGVGTVDQALMSVLQTKHFFVRLMALANKTVIFDEVHAYDAHMSVIFRLTLTWLRALGSSVVILSATLPLTTRQNLLRAYLGQETASVMDKGYPSIVWANASGAPRVIELERKPQDRTLPLKYVGREPADIATELRQALKEGGCAVVVCNRVKRAQELYQALEQLFENEFQQGWMKRDDLTLFHARFPVDERKIIEDNVLKNFGKPIDKDGTNAPDRPPRAILIATQVVEQSLDLDFDVMISDVAPIDLLIQRAGRLWRHERKHRPVNDLLLRLTLPEETGDVPEFGKDAFVYQPYTLLRTWLELQRQPNTQLVLPSQTRDLIESVYGSEDEMPDASAFSLVQQAALQKFWNKLREKESDVQYEAERQLIPVPSVSAEQLLNYDLDEREEDDPTVTNYWRAKTRDILPSISLICLHLTPQGLALDTEGRRSLSLADFNKPDLKIVKTLMGRVVTVTHQKVVDYFVNASNWPEKQKPLIAPPEWKKHGALRHCRVAVFTNGIFKLGATGLALKLTDHMGLEVVPAN